MKKLLPLLSLILLLTACGGQSTSSPNSSENVSGGDTPIGGNTSDGESSGVIGTDGGQNIDHDNPREYFTAEEAAEIINRSGNLKTSDEYFYALVPKSIDHVSEFYRAYGVPLSEKEALEEFLAVYEYLFPEHEMNKSCLYYSSPLPDDPDIEPERDDNGFTIKDETYMASIGMHPIFDEKYYDWFLSGELGDPRTSAYFYYSEDLYQNENSVSLMMRSPFGNDICFFNKGVAQKIIEERDYGVTEFYAWQTFAPDSSDGSFDHVGCFTPDSEEKFMLLDREISIKDAVKNFEDYIASIPCASDSEIGISVRKVFVYKADSEHYYYWFLTSPIYDGIPFADGTWGGMIKSGDVDFAAGTNRALRVLEETPHTEIIPFEKAVEITAEKMTEYVDFKVEEAALVYRAGADIAGISPVGEGRYPVSPVWYFKLDNPNDDLYYYAYVNALTGDFSVTTSKN